MQDLSDLQLKISAWSEEINPDQTIESLLKHLVEEAEDLLKDAYNSMAYADVIILLLAAAKKANYSVTELIQATETKMTLNQARIFLPPDKDGITRRKAD